MRKILMLIGIGAMLTSLVAVPVASARPMYLQECLQYPVILAPGTHEYDITYPYIPGGANNAWATGLSVPGPVLEGYQYNHALNYLAVYILSYALMPVDIDYCYMEVI